MDVEHGAARAKFEVIEVVRRFTSAFDRLDAEEMKAQFMPNGTWHRLAGTVSGHAGIDSLLENLPAGFLGRHILSNQIVTIRGDDGADCLSYITVFHVNGPNTHPLPVTLGGSLHLVGDCRDRLTLTVEGWKIAERRVTPIFKR